MSTTAEQKLERIRRALLIGGRRPDWHRHQLGRLWSEWPTLYDAVTSTLTEAEKARLNPSPLHRRAP